MKTILVPCDFSQSSIEALKFATLFAQKEKAELKLIHSIQLPVLYDSSVILSFEQNYMRDQRAAALKKLNKTIDRWVAGSVKAQADVEFGNTLVVIESAAELSKADLIVMGTNGASGIKEYTIGSNTEKIVRKSEVPVIAIHKAPKTVSNIVFATQPDGDQEEISMQVKALQNLFKAKLHLLYVNTPASFQRDADVRPKLEAFAKRYMLKNYTLNVYNDISESEGIISFTNALSDPMVVMRTHGRLGITHLAVGSIAEDVVNHIKCPIWTMKIK